MANGGNGFQLIEKSEDLVLIGSGGFANVYRQKSTGVIIKKLKDEEYAREHPQFELITPEEKYHLRICAFLNEPSDSDIYKTNFAEDDIQSKQEYIDMVRTYASYVTGEPMTLDDRLVILSTCAYEYKDARYMVVCRMLPWE